MTVELEVSNDLPTRHMGPRTRQKLIAERNIRVAVDNVGDEVPLFVKVIASLKSPPEITARLTRKEDILMTARHLYGALPYKLRHTDPMDGQWLPRHVGEIKPTGVQVDARVGMLNIRPTHIDGLVRHMGQATMAGLAFCDAWAELGWTATHTVRLIIHKSRIPPDWLITGCAAQRFTLETEMGNIATRS